MSGPKPDNESEAEAPEKRRLVLDVPVELWDDLVRESGEATIADGKITSVSEVARRRLVNGAKAIA